MKYGGLVIVDNEIRALNVRLSRLRPAIPEGKPSQSLCREGLVFFVPSQYFALKF